MSSDTLSRLRYMANQIAQNIESMGEGDPVLGTADHIDKFWDPRMKQAIFADDRSVLSPVARAAIDHLAQGAHPPPQSRATEFNAVDEVGHSDAG